jgi:hypothetical protein
MTLETLKEAYQIEYEIRHLDSAISMASEAMEKDDPVSALAHIAFHWHGKRDEVKESMKELVEKFLEIANREKGQLLKQLEAL